jgi:Alcohol dehydrogenase GroES-like domain
MTTAVAVATMKAARMTAAGAGLRIPELEVPDPGSGQVRIKVQACDVCHSDVVIVEGGRPEEMWPAMNGNNKPAIKPSATERPQPWTGLSCPECEERSYLRVLVAELLYRNQVLRSDLIEARDQVERIERVGFDRRGDDRGN